jgi:hypothetical protein
MNETLLILLALVWGYREIQILIDRGSYKKENLRFNPYWYKDQNSKEKYLGLFPKKNFDSFHVAAGLIVLIINIITKDNLPHPFIDAWFYIPVYWVILMQIRNLAMKIIYRE